MKVEVLTDKEAEFGRFCWWSKWIDVAIYSFGSEPWLIQMSVSRRNRKKFRSVAIVGSRYCDCDVESVGDLTQMSKAVEVEKS